MFYTGKEPWNGPRNLRELLEPLEDAPIDMDPLSFQLIDEARFPVDQYDAPGSPLLGLFRLEQSRSLEEALEHAKELGEQLRGPEHDKLRQALAQLLSRAIIPTVAPGTKLIMDDLLETRTMLAESAIEWRDAWILQGKKEGKKEGEKRGEKRGWLKGQQTLLLRLLESKFGPLPAWAKQRVGTANAERISLWTERVLKAETLDEIFA